MLSCVGSYLKGAILQNCRKWKPKSFFVVRDIEKSVALEWETYIECVGLTAWIAVSLFDYNVLMITRIEVILLDFCHPGPPDSLQILPKSSPPCTYLPLPRKSYSWRNTEAVSRLKSTCLVHDVIFLYLFTFWPHFCWAINIWKFKQIGQFSPNITKLIQIVSPHKTSKIRPDMPCLPDDPFMKFLHVIRSLSRNPEMPPPLEPTLYFQSPGPALLKIRRNTETILRRTLVCFYVNFPLT